MQIGLYEHDSLGLNTVVAFKRAREAANSDERSGHQNSANGDLQTQQHVAHRKAACAAQIRSAGANDLPGIGAEHLAHRDHAEEDTAEDGQQESQGVGRHVRIHRHIDGDIGNRPPGAQQAQDGYGSRHAHNTSGERKHKGLGEKLADDELAARSKSHADRDLARAVGRPGSEETAQIGARGEQNEAGQKHEASHERAGGLGEGISGESGPG